VRSRTCGRACAWLALALAAGIVIALVSGPFPTSLAELTGLSEPSPHAVQSVGMARTVLWEIRGPRVLASVLVGAGLAACGCALQSVFRNPLASPDLLGVSAGAAVGAVLGIFLGWAGWATQLSAFAGGLAAVGLVYLVGTLVAGADRILSLVLAGVAVSSMLAALISLFKTLADPLGELPAITFWLMGSFAAIERSDLVWLAACGLIGIMPIALLRWRTDALVLSDEEMRTVGLSPGWLRLWLVAGASLLTASSVAVVGIVGWVGLVVPHAARLITGASFARLLPVAMLMGGLLMLAIDTAGRSLFVSELPPGILAALLGGPVLLLLMWGRRDG
jgi:iron complex transport system permease protein